MNDPYNLRRFIDGQHGVYENALGELRAGSKQSHWMWFVFPQLRGLGFSPTALFYAIASIDEASAYLNDPLLGARLRECVDAILRWAHRRTADEILGSIDSMKLRSSLTLFDRVEPEGLFAAALDSFFGGERDARTLALLNASA